MKNQERGDGGRCPTGIRGFDELVSGGLPRARTILLNGACGTGKTVFATQFITNGILHHDEPAVFVMLEQDAGEFKEDMRGFGIDLQKMEDDGKLVIINANLTKKGGGNFFELKSETHNISPEMASIDRIVEVIEGAARSINARRAVIDSLSSMSISFEDARSLRRLILDLNYCLKRMGLTTIIISDEVAGDVTEATEKYVVDGVITLRYVTIGPDPGRTLVIDKMRRTRHSENIHTLRFCNEGVEVTNE
ncbi:MAG: ATPase domain-containing protein [Candidatus Altiarchaeota archaeon]